MPPLLNHRIVLSRRPVGPITHADFSVEAMEVDEIPDDHLVLKVVLIQIAPAARAVMTNTTPFERTRVGDGILCALVGEVVNAPENGPPVGSMMTSYGLWEEYAVVPATQARPIAIARPLTDNLGPLGLNGLTAYFGVTRIGRPEAGETVVVSAAAGGVGHLAGQLARIAGARIIGITGSDSKNHRLEVEYGFDGTVNHRSPTFAADLAAACPHGADVFFDNVGGAVLDAMLPLMARHGRVVCCGAASQYDHGIDDVLQPGPHGVPQHLINRNVRMEGFATADFLANWGEGLTVIADHLNQGRLRAAAQTWHGLESAPSALLSVLRGGNFGQAIVRLQPDPQ